MRGLILFLPALLLAQTPAPKTQPAAAPAKQGVTKAAPTAAKGAPVPAKKAATPPKPAGPPPLTTDDEKTIYALGLSFARSLAQLDLSPAELEIVKRALSDAAAGKP